MAGAEATLWQIRSAQAVRSEPTDLSAVLDFDVRADTVFGAVMNVARTHPIAAARLSRWGRVQAAISSEGCC